MAQETHISFEDAVNAIAEAGAAEVLPEVAQQLKEELMFSGKDLDQVSFTYLREFWLPQWPRYAEEEVHSSLGEIARKSASICYEMCFNQMLLLMERVLGTEVVQTFVTQLFNTDLEDSNE